MSAVRRRRAGRRAALTLLLVPTIAAGVESTSPPPDPASHASLAAALAVDPILSPNGVVVSSSEEASRAGARILEAGGNAVDAAVATAFALSAVDPSESGLGGESWILIHRVGGPPVAILCPSRVPRRVDVAALRAARDTVGVTGHLAATTPTTVAALAHALSRYGTKSLAEVLAPAIEEAERGWTLGWYEAAVLGANVGRISLSPVLFPILFPGECSPNGYPLPAPAGARLRLPALAGTLRRLAEAGARDFYQGRIASEIDADMRANGGFVRKEDLARVPGSVVEIEPIRAQYRDREVLSIGAPAAGGILVETLQILSNFPSGVARSSSPDFHQLLVEAVRIAKEDFRKSAAVSGMSGGAVIPWNLMPSHTAARAREIRLGEVWNVSALKAPERSSPEMADHTTQISVVDSSGNAVSITQTLAADWGSGSAGERLGFPYNSVLAWYALDNPGDPAFARPYSFLPVPSAPTIVLRDGSVEMVLGSPGSSRIVPAIVSVIRNVVDGGMSLADAVSAPRVLWQDEGKVRRIIVEALPPITGDVLEKLQGRGYGDLFVVREAGTDLGAFGCVNAAGWNGVARAWEGVGDPRRKGVAAIPSRPAVPTR